MADVVKMTIYVVNIKNNTEVWRARQEFLAGISHARHWLKSEALRAPRFSSRSKQQLVSAPANGKVGRHLEPLNSRTPPSPPEIPHLEQAMMKIDCFKTLLPKRKTSCYLRPVVHWLLPYSLSRLFERCRINSFRLERHRRFLAGSVDHEGGGTVRETRSRHDAHLSRRGSRAIQVLLSGDVPIVQGGGNSPVAARLRGGDVT